MQHKSIQVTGLVLTAIYAALIIWVYATEPRTFREVANSASVATGSYQVDQEKFTAALALFRRDARTQFYLAYAFYREGWGRVYYDQDLFKQGLEKVNHAIGLAPAGPLTVDDPNLQMHSAVELKAELEQGTERGWSDLNPLKILRTRK